MKAAVEIISALLIFIFALGLFATAYSFGLPLIQKRQDIAVVDRVNALFNPDNINSLASKISDIANKGGETRFTVEVEGFWQLYPCADRDSGGIFFEGCGNFGVENNSIAFTFGSRASKIAPNIGWVSLSGTSCPPQQGNVGSDKAAAVCVRADTRPDGVFNITYRVWFRELVDPTSNVFKINLLQHSSSLLTSTGKTVQIIFNGRRTASVAGKTISTTEVKILLV